MLINELLTLNKMTKYSLAKKSNVPYATLNDICNGKTNLAKCNAETVYRLAKALNVPMEQLLQDSIEQRCSFELFKSNVCHRLKRLGDIDFIIETIESDDIITYFEKRWYAECLYLLAMTDYVCRVNNVPLYEGYDELRKLKLTKMIYPAGILALCEASGSDEPKKEALEESIPEFTRFNIVESEVRDVA